MASAAKQLEEVVASWPGVSVQPHQFDAQEFRFGDAEVGHVHLWGDVDIPFPKAIRDYLLEHRLAEQHRWVPNSGWATFHMSGVKDVEHAEWLMRLSYLRYALKTAGDPRGLLEAEAVRLKLEPELVATMQQHLPKRGPGGVAA